MPPLFHYTSCDILKLIARNKQLRFTCVSNLNDVDEWVGGVRFFCEAARGRRIKRLNEFAEGFESVVNGEQPLPWFIACFSARPDICSQWERYGDNHQGVCITFDSKWLVSDFVSLHEVRYGEDSWTPVVNALLDDIERLPADDDFTIAIGTVCQFAAQCKTKGWEMEQEIRLFTVIPDPVLIDDDPASKQRVASWQGRDDMDRKYAMLPIESKAIARVTVGKYADEQVVKNILGEFGLSHVEVKKPSLHHNDQRRVPLAVPVLRSKRMASRALAGPVPRDPKIER